MSVDVGKSVTAHASSDTHGSVFGSNPPRSKSRGASSHFLLRDAPAWWWAGLCGALLLSRIGSAEDHRPPGRLYQIPSVTRPTRAVTLQVWTRPANWDADAANDGIEVTILPLSDAGSVVPVDGQLSVSLTGRKYVRRHAREDVEVRLGQWSQRVRPADFTGEGAAYRFPFSGRDPLTDTSLAATGLVEVSLAAPAHGRLETRTLTALRSLRWPLIDQWIQ